MVNKKYIDFRVGTDEDGNPEFLEIYTTEAHNCFKCEYEFTKEDLTKGELGKVKKGPGKGRSTLTVFCVNCGQKKIIILGEKH